MMKDFFNQVKIHFVHIFEGQNSGEMLCGVYDYFDAFSQKFLCLQHDIRTLNRRMISSKDWVILGGGGLLGVREDFQDTINFLLNKTYKVVLWSVGHNSHIDRIINTKIDFYKFLFYSTRDFNYNDEEYCPCPSCMSSLLNIKRSVIRKFGIIEHLDYSIEEFKFDKIKNSYSPRTIMNFIAESECIITNSYHAAYWATLMKKKVIIYKAFSTKFSYYKFEPVFYSGDLESDFNKAKIYKNALNDSRKINIEFADKIFNAISLIDGQN